MDEAGRRAGEKHRAQAELERKMAIIAAGARSGAATFRLCDPAKDRSREGDQGDAGRASVGHQ
jgi:hypothetical protein